MLSDLGRKNKDGTETDVFVCVFGVFFFFLRLTKNKAVYFWRLMMRGGNVVVFECWGRNSGRHIIGNRLFFFCVRSRPFFTSGNNEKTRTNILLLPEKEEQDNLADSPELESTKSLSHTIA